MTCQYQSETVWQVNLNYPATGQEPQRVDGLVLANRHLNYLAESSDVNVGG